MSQGNALCRWEVTAGFGPEAAADRFTRMFVVTYEDWAAGDGPGQRLRAARRDEAVAYATTLMSDESFAWVRVDYRSDDHPWTDDSGVESDA